jgi:predicted transcriptional regulator of viral defense system
MTITPDWLLIYELSGSELILYLTRTGTHVVNFVLISSNSKKIVFSHQTALYLHDLSDRTPRIFHIPVPQGYNASQIRKKDLHPVGLTNIETPLGNAEVYDMERAIRDGILDREKDGQTDFHRRTEEVFQANR